MWDWLTSPSRREQWQADRIEQMTPGGRARVGATNHCIHGADAAVEEIVDWRPFRYFTMRYQFPEIGGMLWTTEFEPDDGQTVVRVRGERLTGRRRAAWETIGPMVVRGLDAMVERLREQLDAVAAGSDRAD